MAHSDTARERDLAPAVTRAVRLLQLLADRVGEPQALADLARELDVAKSSVSNICGVLESAGMIRRAGVGYELDARTVEFGAAYLRGVDPIREFYRFCEGSQFLVNEVVQIAMLDGTDVIYLARHEGQAPLRLSANTGDRFPAAPTAVGQALLAHLPRSDVERRFAHPDAFPRRTPQSTPDLATLQTKLDAVRERGYAVDDNEMHPGIYGIAMWVPPRTVNATPLAVGASLFTAAMTTTTRAGVVSELRALATVMSYPYRAEALFPDEDASSVFEE